MVERIHHIEIALGIERHPGGPIELPITGPGLAPLAQKVAFFVEDRDAIECLVGDVKMLVFIHHDADRPAELSIPCARSADGAQVFVIPGEAADFRGQLTAAQDVDPPFLSQC